MLLVSLLKSWKFFFNLYTFQFQQFNTPSTVDPFRQPPLQSTTEFNFNQFQNNEIGSNQPIDPFGSSFNNFDRNRPRPQVDEFGNPLGEIYNVDTTRFELGVGVQSDELR